MSESPQWREGLSDSSSVGWFGSYRDGRRSDLRVLPTCVWRPDLFLSFCTPRRALFSVELPADYAVEDLRVSWTGMTRRYRYGRGEIDLDLRMTLPGPMFAVGDTSFGLRLAGGNGAHVIEEIDSGRQWKDPVEMRPENGRFFLLRCPRNPLLVVASEPVMVVRNISHYHWEFRFAGAGARLLVVPWIGEFSRDAIRANRDVWMGLVSRPPIECAEFFAEDAGGGLALRQVFGRAAYAPVPAFWALPGLPEDLFSGPADTADLCATVFGPYRVVPGSSWQGRIAADWMEIGAGPTRVADGRLEGLPRELVYAGDRTWDESSCMDRLLSWRSWGWLVGAMPEDLRAELIRRIPVPSAEEFRAALVSFEEINVGRRWLRDRTPWDDRGDASYDPDWYIGLSLAGLARAVFAADARIGGPAKATALACKPERAGLAAYMEIFHDWMLGSASTDPRGGLWWADCVHNGMEGLIGESRLRAIESDADGALKMRYLSAKTAVALLAAIFLGDWLKARVPEAIHHFKEGDPSFLRADKDDRVFAINGFSGESGFYPITPATRNPYCFVGHFPEYWALFRHYGPVGRMRELAAIWEREYPARYADWLEFYAGADWRAKWDAGDHEAREQAAVFYHLAPDVGLRLWAFGETPESVEGRFATPLNLAEQILLRGGFLLEKGVPGGRETAQGAGR